MRNRVAKAIALGMLVTIIFLIYRDFFPVLSPFEIQQAKKALPLEQERLLNAMNVWREHSNSDYQFSVEVTPGYSTYILCPISQITYRNGEIVTFEYLSSKRNETREDDSDNYCKDFIENTLSMDALFKEIQADLNAGPENISLEVEYDPDYGFVSYYKHVDINCMKRHSTGCHWAYRFETANP